MYSSISKNLSRFNLNIFAGVGRQKPHLIVNGSRSCDTISGMVDFDDKKRDDKLEGIREEEAERLAEILSQKYKIPYNDLSLTPINVGALKVIEEEDARKAEIAPFNLRGKKVDIGIHSPNKEETKEALRIIEESGYKPQLFLVSTRSLEHVWERYADFKSTTESERGTLSISNKDIGKFIKEVKSLDDVKNNAQEKLKGGESQQITKVIEVVLAGGMALKASDIHIEPRDEDVLIRYRLDGVLVDVTSLDHKTYNFLISRIKLLSGLKINLENIAQDGRFSIVIDETEIEIRTSILPGPNGEAVVMRILNPNAISLELESLGIHPRLLEAINKEIEKPNGMILTTGPTGSGKTTTLYAFLTKVNSPQTKIITIENPIEYHLEGIVQTQTDEEAGYTFLEGLRSALRQDPDVIMVGEIRDNQTAETAVNAALTGHLVFSTLHTNTAAGSFPRLLGLGVNAKVVTSAINMTLAQRLVRKLCPECAQKVPLEGEEAEKINKVLNSITDESYLKNIQKEEVWHPVGCPKCSEAGYKGRVGVYEGILTTSKIEEVVQKNPSDREIRESARDQGLLTLAQDGVLKVLQGVTALDELERIVDLDEF